MSLYPPPNLEERPWPTFLGLPAEIRLEIYRHLTDDCLANGTGKDLAELSVSCHLINREMKEPSIQNFRSLFAAMKTWEHHSLGHKQLRIIAHTPNATSKKLTVKIPWVHITAWDHYNDRRIQSYALKKALEMIDKCIWSTWALTFVDGNGAALKPYEAHMTPRWLEESVEYGLEIFKLARLEFMCPFNGFVTDYDEVEMICYLELLVRHPGITGLNERPLEAERVACFWVTGTSEKSNGGYSLVFDYGYAQGRPKRALWKYTVSGNVYQCEVLLGENGEHLRNHWVRDTRGFVYALDDLFQDYGEFVVGSNYQCMKFSTGEDGSSWQQSNGEL